MSILHTIVAHATPNGRSSVGILRISGSLTTMVAQQLLGKLPRQRQAEYLPFYDRDGTILDKGIALFFPGPHSFTGEDVLELHGHGGPVILDILLQSILTLPGIRIARPGEFSERAFLNDKIDLTQAEAIADLIDASSVQAARAAVSSLRGIFSQKINTIITELTKIRIDIEAIINFPDLEERNISSESNIKNSLKKIISNLSLIRTEAYQSSILRDGIKVVITGKPNVGKSSIINALSCREVAIVTAIAGTTRDVLHEHINLDGIPIHIIDTAGLCNSSNDEIERIGIKRAWCEIEQADHILLVVDSSTTQLDQTNLLYEIFIQHFPSGKPVTIIRNKADLTSDKIGKKISKIKENEYSFITLSALSGEGINVLREHLKHSIGFTISTENNGFLARRRHLDALKTAEQYLRHGKDHILFPDQIELLAEDLQLAHKALSEITGQLTSNDLLTMIFSRFCIGK
ncbi:tRNA uridine-5-carboxymethylaminomethyl(34) synthesis GTPase MnmE [Candidatus Palibaumannia cicadellinicola]|uniref:tRNA modification GTPase MnmE n=1 Tax=Candidatus Palibaumannia cicadellinicola TaxID=186490 RepID=A0A2N4XWJ7_9GAMM|nr:tRNA uridine-5-carboxymethylaminomethyl(34) synthesis GTPase MnmE [Candidatus Baumannia cicadellinicola]PLK58419.1 tRNA uridine-5-carboxymethylaminomethyl(34) synthesis GTPase MnmE [Candidatus Baumannia cicadellinicola]